MSDLVRIRRALLSVSDKTDLAALRARLAELGVELVSTGGTARALREGGPRRDRRSRTSPASPR